MINKYEDIEAHEVFSRVFVVTFPMCCYPGNGRAKAKLGPFLYTSIYHVMRTDIKSCHIMQSIPCGDHLYKYMCPFRLCTNSQFFSNIFLNRDLNIN